MIGLITRPEPSVHREARSRHLPSPSAPSCQRSTQSGTHGQPVCRRPAAGLAQPLGRFFQRLGRVGNGAIVRGFARLAGCHHGNHYRRPTYVHANKPCRLVYDTSPVPEVSHQTVQCDPRSSTHDDKGHPVRAGNGHEVLTRGYALMSMSRTKSYRQHLGRAWPAPSIAERAGR